jgi:uncharacterized ion transporter superfamily protein YfcC
LGGRGRWIVELEASLVYKVSSWTASTIKRNPVSKTKKTKKKKKKKMKEEEEEEEKKEGRRRIIIISFLL